MTIFFPISVFHEGLGSYEGGHSNFLELLLEKLRAFLEVAISDLIIKPYDLSCLEWEGKGAKS